MNISIIGGGNLGTAIAKGLKEADASLHITVSRRSIDKIAELEKKGIVLSKSNTAALSEAQVVVIAVKPHQLEGILAEIKAFLRPGQMLVSVVTGKEMREITQAVGADKAVFRVMPNTAVANRESMNCVCYENADETQKSIIDELFKKLGENVFIEEKLMDSATVLCACGVAFALRYIRAAMQAGIQIGFDSETALKIVSQTVKGASTLLLENQSHPEREIDKVTTPQGCTIVGLNEMEHQGFSSALIKGIQHSFEAIDGIKKK